MMSRHREMVRVATLMTMALLTILVSPAPASDYADFVDSYPTYGYEFSLPYTAQPYTGPYLQAVYTANSFREFWIPRTTHVVYGSYKYGDPYEVPFHKRGPLLRDKPPYPAVRHGSEGLMVPPMKLWWSGDRLNVQWTARAEPVKSVDLAVTDQYNNVLAQQSLTEAPFRVRLAVPEGARYVRVTVRYADGGVTSSALPVRGK